MSLLVLVADCEATKWIGLCTALPFLMVDDRMCEKPKDSLEARRRQTPAGLRGARCIGPVRTFDGGVLVVRAHSYFREATEEQLLPEHDVLLPLFESSLEIQGSFRSSPRADILCVFEDATIKTYQHSR